MILRRDLYGPPPCAAPGQLPHQEKQMTEPAIASFRDLNLPEQMLNAIESRGL